MQRDRQQTASLERDRLDALPQIVWFCDPTGTISYVNRRWEDYTGLDNEQAGGLKFLDITHPGDRQRIGTAWQRAAEAGEELEIEWRLRAADGSYRWFVGQCCPMRDQEGAIVEWVGTSIDIHARRALEERLAAGMERRVEERTARLREAEARFRFLFDHSPEGITLLDPYDSEVPWRIVEANDAFCRMNGFAREELVGKSIDVLHHDPAPLPEREKFVEKLRRVPYVTLRAEHFTRDGEPFTVEAVTTLVTIGGRELVLGADRDITERERADAALKAANAELQTSNAELERFAYTISHDLRAPLLSIQGMSSLLDEALNSGDDDEARFLLGRIVQNASRMGDLLSAVLAVSRAGRQLEDAQLIDAGQVARQVLNEFESRILARQTVVDLPSEWPVVRYPPAELYQVVANLVGNAIKWAGRRKATSSDRPEPEQSRVELSWERAGSFVNLRVADNGPGVPEAYREKVFGLFQKLDLKSEGSGVGLAIVKRIVERHGGRVWVEDSPLGGAAFVASLPLESSGAAAD